MTTEVIITGTGSPVPDADRAGPGVLVRSGDLALQFDAGRSTVQRLAAVGMWNLQLTAVFATHHHSDHLTGLADLVLSHWVMARGDDFTPIQIVVPAGPAEDYVSEMLHPWRHDLAVRAEHSRRSRTVEMELTAFEVPESPTEVWRSGDVAVSAGQVRHEPVFPAVGYRVSTPDGDVVITGDTLVCDEVAELAAGADVLVYEAMLFPQVEQGPPIRHFILDYHADTRLIGPQAAELGMPTLVLTHLIPAPAAASGPLQRPGAAVSEHDFESPIREGGYTGDLLVARDLDKVVLEAGVPPRIERRD
ncbi:MBL fold metallo-hydrolase [Candidatus Poriferisodalis sp.]|uniref:MBL fold metallo-hydrolase n=1 Tax=Candidatus Poriferisodalis sp. TaxID=3101277 RepID=UPI003B02A088